MQIYRLEGGVFSDVRGSGLIFGCSGFGRWGGYFRTFGVRGSFSDVRGLEVGGPFSDIRGLFSDVRGSTPNVRKRQTSKFGHSGFGVRGSKNDGQFSDIRGSYVRGSTPNIRNAKTPKTPNV